MNPMPPQKWSIRPATLEDVPKIFQIETQVHPSPWTEVHFQEELTKPYSHFLVFTDDETDLLISGYLIFWTLFDEAQILNLAVAIDYRGLGLAKSLVRKAITLAQNKNLKKITLEVRKSNSPAIHLYQNMGFSIVHIRKNFYQNGEDAYQMAIDLA
jgi:[ribosomal protein S18]-alanine N-acetyltransferase